MTRQSEQHTMAGNPAERMSAAHTQGRAAQRSRQAIGYAGVALLSLALGAAGAFFGLRAGQVSPITPGATGTAGRHEDHTAIGTAAPARASADQAVFLAPERQQLIGVRTEAVTHRALEATIRTVGIIAYDETRVAEIHTKIPGWVEKLHVDFVGKPVGRGQPLFCVYSPELVSTQKEYLLARKARAQLATSQFAETREGADSLLSATRERLRLWDISDAQIDELERTGQVRKTLTLYSPFDGVVIERSTFPGHYLMPEMPALKVADLSTIWVTGEIYEYEVARVKVGQAATIEFPYGATARTLTGKVAFVYPNIDPQTRRAKVRVEFRNRDLTLKPGAYVTVILTAGGAHELAVSREAVIDTGTRQYVILARGNGYFEPREVRVGRSIGDFYPVMSGLSDGDVVVTSAQFLIDSETNLQAAMKSMVGHGHDGYEAKAERGGRNAEGGAQPAAGHKHD